MAKFFVVIEVGPQRFSGKDDYDGDKHDVACWIDSALPTMSAYGVDATVWDNLKDFLADHLLDSLAESG